MTKIPDQSRNMMAKIAALGLILLLVGALTASAFCDELRAVRADSPPRIDGNLDDACWKAAAPADGFTIKDTNKPSPLKTNVWFVYDDDTLYVAAKCFTPDFSLVKAKKVARDGRIISYDSVEIMIDADRDKGTYVHLMTNASGSQFDRWVTQNGWVGDKAWDGEWKTASKIGTDSYTVEFAIPFYTLDIGRNTSSTWNINVCRNVRTSERSAYTSLAPGGAYNTPTKFPALGGIDVDFGRYMLAVSSVRTTSQFADKKTHITVVANVTNEASATRTVRAENWLIDSTGKVLVKTMGAMELATGKKQPLSFGPYILDKSGTYKNWLLVVDAKTRRTLAISKSPVDIECVPIALRIVDPFYRNTIFVTQKLKTVQLEVDVGLQKAEMGKARLDLEVVPAEGGEALVKKSLKGLSPVSRFEFQNSALPEVGKFIVQVALTDGAGEKLADTQQMLLKLPYKKGEVWYGRDLVFRRDGKPIFPNGSWGTLTPARNFLLYGIFKNRTVTPVIPGKYKVWYTTSSADNAELKSTKPFSEAFIADFRERIRFYRDDSDILAWVQPDEPECSSYPPKKLEQLYEITREEDPYHPVWISNNSIEGVKTYARCADASVPHPYPPALPEKRINDLFKLLKVQRAFLEYTDFTKPVGFMHQGFNYGEYVPGSRMPTYYETRNQNVLSLADGGTFLMGFESSVLQNWYPEVAIGLDYLTQELAYLSKAVTAPKATNKVTCANKDVVTLLKDADGDLFLFVSNASNDPRKLAVTVEGLESRKLNVISEGRSVQSKGDVINDSFDTWETHIYTTSAEDPGLKTVQEITAIIEVEYVKRQKPGNLAFQRWSNQAVDITSSSRDGIYPPEPWHACDGITDISKIAIRFASQHSWTDGTPNKSPDWLALKFKKPHSIKRVVVYTGKESIKDYKIQARKGDNWIDVASGSNNQDNKIEHFFDPVVTDQVRLYITATNGSHAIVTEMEVYEKK
ncbi:MAG: discoidin domain-containing protein [bacterium]|nr:discoidin domain-containing protein [bacterium]